MKPSELVEALERFFLDIIAYVLPGSALLVGGALLFRPSSLALTLDGITRNSYYVLGFLAASYVIGQALETSGGSVLEPIMAILARASRWLAGGVPHLFLWDRQKMRAGIRMMKLPIP
jgi:hypothetical protein